MATDSMPEEPWQTLCLALGLPATADLATLVTTANAAHAALATLGTIDSARADFENQAATANAAAVALAGECAALRTELAAVQAAHLAEAEVLRRGALDLAERKGALAPAERGGFAQKLTANAAGTFAELRTRHVMNTQPVQINGNRVDLSTANARQAAFDAEVTRRMRADGLDRDTAFARCLADPALAGLTGAMRDPTKL
jgi:hypothetical protein